MTLYTDFIRDEMRKNPQWQAFNSRVLKAQEDLINFEIHFIAQKMKLIQSKEASLEEERKGPA